MKKEKTALKQGRRESVAEKRTRILEAALDLLRTGGVESMTMRMIADRCSISLGNLQYHFKNRPAVLEALAQGFLETYLAQTRQALARKGHPDLESCLQYLFEQEVEEDCAAVFKELWALSHRDPTCRAALERYYQDLRENLAAWLEEVVPDRTGDWAAELAVLLIPFLEGICITKAHLEYDTRRISGMLAAMAKADPLD